MKANETKTVSAETFSALATAAREALEDGNTDLLVEVAGEILNAEIDSAEIIEDGAAIELMVDESFRGSFRKVTVRPE